jgi:hypothetical protein
MSRNTEVLNLSVPKEFWHWFVEEAKSRKISRSEFGMHLFYQALRVEESQTFVEELRSGMAGALVDNELMRTLLHEVLMIRYMVGVTGSGKNQIPHMLEQLAKEFAERESAKLKGDGK